MPSRIFRCGIVGLLLAGCSSASPSRVPTVPRPSDAAGSEIAAVNVSQVAAPAAGAITSRDVQTSEHMVARIMRLGPGASIAEHHHPFFDESFIVQAGVVVVLLNDQRRELQAGDVAIIPAGTTISGRNEGANEAVVVVVWANRGMSGPLTVPGRP